MSSEEFEKLHEIYKSIYNELKQLIQRGLPLHREEKKRLLKDFDDRVGEAEEMLEEMDKVLLGAPASFRNQMSAKLRGYRRDMGRLQRDIKNAGSISTLSAWPGDSRHGTSASYTKHMQTQCVLLLQGTESLDHATRSIKQSQRIAEETDQVGSDLIEELGEQREQLDRIRYRVIHTGENLSTSRKFLHTISCRSVTNHMLLFLVILLEVAILGAVIYLKFFRK